MKKCSCNGRNAIKSYYPYKKNYYQCKVQTKTCKSLAVHPKIQERKNVKLKIYENKF